MADRYWVGDATGIWDASETGNWSTTSGGLGGASVPTSADDVYFDGNARTDVSVGTTVYCRNFTVTSGFNNTLGGSGGVRSMQIYGNISINKSASISATLLQFNMLGAGTSRTVRSTGNNLRSLTISGSGVVTLEDTLVLTSTLYVYNGGTFDTAGYPMSAASLILNTSSSTMYLRTSVISLTGSSTAIALSEGTVVPGTSTIRVATDVSTIHLAANTPLYNLEFTSPRISSVTFTTSTSTNIFTINSIKHPTIRTGNTTYTFKAGSRYIIGSWQINGSAGMRTLLRSSVAGARYTLSSTAQVDGAYLDIQDSAATDVPWYAANSTDSGNNTGWTFTAPATATSALFFGSNF